MTRQIKAFEQGELDGLCGIYSIINSIHALHGPLNQPTAFQLFMRVIKHLEQQANPLLVRLEEGTTTPELSKGLCSASSHYPIRWARPFHQRKNISLDDYWQHAQQFIADQQGVFIINVVKGHVLDHWTLAHRISDKSIFLLDSAGFKRLYRRNCTVTQEQHSNRIWLNPSCSFFIWKDTGDKS